MLQLSPKPGLGVGESTPDPHVIDFAILRTAPRELNIASIGDLISAHTGTYDWEYDHQYHLPSGRALQGRGGFRT